MFTNRGLIILGSYFCTINVGAAGLFFYDKQQAIKQRWRVRESTLQLTGLLGGWIGGMWAMEKFKHKRAKQSFKNVYFSAVAGNIGVVGAFFFLYKKFPHLIPIQIRSLLFKEAAYIRPNQFQQATEQQYQQQQQQQQQKRFEEIIEDNNENLNVIKKKRGGRKNKQN
ncbi:hypothetical protein DICPUDRAFT_86664 [Dictyostelium purpureum]|uniref:DUF1294 domain-containing protein n=1 Tax=Dictyostelium purpureum TaxID=5786 RepID=F0ZD57_DICPU|nr:uncharacterized protein DICPUDRAFT_86664 [Dictyostelium purpureum]EGC38119.1 hypothetical protein DICPUDRAFT_86664 [Dictyostelium purpureum]|eukprot:XP_003285333.1 hypothetical protein DICPUDRAFT_86664 [Dictyostelium purpureum]